ncbi:calcium-binding protein [Mesorhizobium sp. LHD-90]|uniref:calcium-binding protein n=1 Tax=Mesorhizobium sp. LHD-90 TaxID=3071414 RepID=UPI0027DFC0FD|nr:calcium-binding protein [Mesorhizobium sp. LHD-90]MDQ6434000.1 calcium-binding protein [Mesorhizobium sp. LHD-90]
MATVTMAFPGGTYLPEFVDYNPSLGELLDLHNAALVGTPTATRIVFQLQNGLVLRLNGTGFALDANGWPTAGTLTGVQLFRADGTTVQQTVTGLNLPLVDVYDSSEVYQYEDGFDPWGFNRWLMNGNDTVNGSTGSDDVYGHAGNDILKGGSGDDFLEGGPGKDTYDGGAGFDTLSFQEAYFDPTALRGVVLNATVGTVIDPWGNSETFKNVESFRGTQFADTLNGSSLDEHFMGMGGRDKIDGKGGFDEVRYDRDDRRGGLDGVTVNLTTGLAIDGFGRQDTLVSIERVRGTEADDTLIGSSAANRLRGLGGDDVLDGRAGADDMRGGWGNDTYVVDNAGDTVDENPGSDFADGTDTVKSAITFNLADTTKVFGAVERLTLIGSSAINGSGNSLSNIITGNTANNSLAGSSGNDTLSGSSGNDTLNGGTGDDTLIGGSGKDTLTGAAGKDAFRFNAALSASTNVDTVTDFSVADDTIQLENAIFTALTATGTLAVAAFRANTTGAAGDSSDRIIYETDTGRLLYDADGTGATAGIHFATLTAGLALTNADFSVI